MKTSETKRDRFVRKNKFNKCSKTTVDLKQLQNDEIKKTFQTTVDELCKKNEHSNFEKCCRNFITKNRNIKKESLIGKKINCLIDSHKKRVESTVRIQEKLLN